MLTKKLIDLTVAGITYYQNYYLSPMRIILVFGFILWLIYLGTSIPNYSNERRIRILVDVERLSKNIYPTTIIKWILVIASILTAICMRK